MGINGRAGTGDRGVDWLAGQALTQSPLSILPALLFTANTSCCALPAHSAPADVYIYAVCVCTVDQVTRLTVHMCMMHQFILFVCARNYVLALANECIYCVCSVYECV